METTVKHTIDSLTLESVSILTQTFITIQEEEQQVGSNHRKGYMNTEEGRAELIAEMPEEIQKSVFAIWAEIETETK